VAKPAGINIWLIKISQENDRGAFRLLYDYYYRKMLHWAAYFLKSRHGAEDVVAEVFIRIWKNRKQLKEVKQLDNYLFIAVKRQSLNVLNKESKKKVQPIDGEAFQRKADTDSHPEHQYIQYELEKVVMDTIESLPPRCRLIFQMVRIDGMKYQEVADTLQISIKTVENQLLKATLQLRQHIQEYRSHADMHFYLGQLIKLCPILLCSQIFSIKFFLGIGG